MLPYTWTSADYEPTKGRQVVIKQQRAPRDSVRTPKSAQRLGSEPSPTTFTTENYRRRVHKVGRW